MKLLHNRKHRPSANDSWRPTALSAAVLIGLAAISSIAYSSTNSKTIGDLEIYKSPEGGRTTITMMLDTSESMDVDTLVNGNACDIPSGTRYSLGTEASSTTPSYTRKSCSTNRYFYRSRTTSIWPYTYWFRCSNLVYGNIDYSPGLCGVILTYVPDVSGYQTFVDPEQSRDTYYYTPGVKRYDRLTRMKDAIFKLMDDPKLLDSNNVSIGIGQYASQSNSNNSNVAVRLYKGKITVPAKPLDAAQRTAIKTAVANFRAVGHTPIANAYAEAGAYMLGTTTVSGNSIFELNGFDDSVTASKNGNSYKSPLPTTTTATGTTADNTCNANGIYFMTDGKPTASSMLPNTDTLIRGMRTALNDQNLNVPADQNPNILPNGTLVKLPLGPATSNGPVIGGLSHWPEVGVFARALRNPTLNPKRANILTAVVGFGSDYEVDKLADEALPEAERVIRRLTYTDVNGETKTGEFYNCSKITDEDIRIACNWGAKSHPSLPKVGGFGEGGFYTAMSSDDIVNSVTGFLSNLNKTLPSTPAGTITIPEDPYRASNQLSYAYLPVLTPDVGSNASIWRGNLKKYNLDQGTLFGKNKAKLYNNVAGELSNTTQDIWQTTNFTNYTGATTNDDARAGGVYAQLRTPKSELSSVRTLYVEDFDNATDKKPILRKLSVGSDGKPVGFSALVDTTVYSQANQRRLLAFLGFKTATKSDGNKIDVVPLDDEYISNIVISDLTLDRPAVDIKVLGGVVHSTPTAVSYSATINEEGRVTSPRDDYVLFGSMDGVLHLADADDGQETVAIIPKMMLSKQPTALVEGSSRTAIGQPYFGIDAPWLVTTDYKYDLFNTDGTPKDSRSVTVDDATGKGMFAYGGLRMGGEAFYGMDISKVNKLTSSTIETTNDPKILFTITKDGLVSATTGKSSATGFTRLGQIWNRPTAAKIRINATDPNPTDVLIFAGGYDMQYESEGYVPTFDAPAKGNAIYMIDAKSGELLKSWSKTTDNKNNMIHSITGELTVLDRDNDGLTDHIYAADLGGQVFRIDLQNARSNKNGFIAVDKFSANEAIRLLKPTSTDKYAQRFYERPVVSFYRQEGGIGNGQLFALVNVISGNRSAPLSKIRDSNANANRVYGIIDRDVTNSELYATGFTKTVVDLDDSKLVNLETALGSSATENKKKDAIQLMLGKAAVGNNALVTAKSGWYYPLTRFNGEKDVKYNKGMGESTVIDSMLYTTVYNPDKQYGTPASCSARVAGGSERQLYCLPYGVCMDATSKTGTGGFIPAGQGIQELAIGAFNENNTNIKALVSTTTLADRIKASNRVDSTGGDASAAEYLFSERYTLQPRAWYKRAQ